MALLFSACRKDTEQVVPTEAPVEKVGSNPYSWSLVKQALENLSQKSAGGRVAGTQSVCFTCGPSHQYVRFMPTTEEQIIDLEEAGYDLWDEPLTENDESGRIAATTEVIPSFYSAVPYGWTLPSHIPYQVLDELFLWDEDAGDEEDITDPWQPNPCREENGRPCPKRVDSRANAIAKATNALKENSIDPLALYNESMRLSGNEDEMIDLEEAKRQGSGKRYYPSGTITVDETALGTQIPLKGITIKARRWFKLENNPTDENGQFSIGKGFRKKVKLVAIFKNSNASLRGIVRGWKVWQMAYVMRHKMGTYTRNGMQGMSFNFAYTPVANTGQAAHFVGATFMNALWEMRTNYIPNNGLATLPSNMNVWVSSAITDDASAPMLRRIAETSLISNALDLFLVGVGVPEIALLKRVLQRALPDITCRYGSRSTNTEGSAELMDTFFHEMGHAIHYQQVGNNYWVTFIGVIVSNGGYGNRVTPGSGLVAVSEGWGHYVGNAFAADYYRRNGRTDLADPFLRFIELQIPGRTNWWEWVAFGMLHDMTDTGEPGNTGVVDNVNAYSVNQIFSALQPSVTSVRQFQQEVVNRTNGLQATELQQLVTSNQW